ncbi:PepSY domain-containing protein [Spongiibacter taiwanensis]|uniref:PepSY-associated TM helix domain-containing protein n=1 Tax=Spongiibacter taiwanensis TaxID=1748242 RepID=UPI0020353B87|nr:PepSY-associated TM helix domain-containing protein [Spongiibacter taiwanensis]USA42795.1 PepSY domain-containing protein [Spongiibacter taiwanensis]
MKGGFRDSMTWLHTWTSLVVGWLLFAIFLTGTLVFFRQEINYWMQPELHGSDPSQFSLARVVDRMETMAPRAEQWRISLPNDRERAVEVRWSEPGQQSRRGEGAHLDAATGEVLSPRETAGADFLYRFHFELYGMPREWGRSIVGIASMLMLIALITGIIIHKKIFVDFFTLRFSKPQRSWLDAHAVSAVAALPFHLMITWSGLLLLAGTLVFWNNEGGGHGGGPGGDRRGGGEQVPDELPLLSQPLPDIAALIAQAQQHWQASVSDITIDKPQRPEMKVTLRSAERTSVSAGRGASAEMTFAADGRLLDEKPLAEGEFSIAGVNNFLGLLHQGRFADVALRWLYFVCGLAGTFMTATGLLFWTAKRAKHKLGSVGYELVSGLNVTAIGGLTASIAAFFWASRLLPAELAGRELWEVRVFFSCWLAFGLSALVFRHTRGWLLQLSVAGGLLLLVPALDQLTSPVSLLEALAMADSIRLTFDTLAALFGLALLVLVRHLATRQSTAPVRNKRAPKGRAAEVSAP